MREEKAKKKKECVVVKGLKENRKIVRNAVEVFRKIRADVRIEKAW